MSLTLAQTQTQTLNPTPHQVAALLQNPLQDPAPPQRPPHELRAPLVLTPASNPSLSPPPSP